MHWKVRFKRPKYTYLCSRAFKRSNRNWQSSCGHLNKLRPPRAIIVSKVRGLKVKLDLLSSFGDEPCEYTDGHDLLKSQNSKFGNNFNQHHFNEFRLVNSWVTHTDGPNDNEHAFYGWGFHTLFLRVMTLWPGKPLSVRLPASQHNEVLTC
jgi:hypothetical protein